MLSADEKGTGKAGQRRGKKKTEPRTKASKQHSTKQDRTTTDELQVAMAETSPEVSEDTSNESSTPTSVQMDASAAPFEGSPNEASGEVSIEEPATEAPREAVVLNYAVNVPAASTELAPVSLRTIADAYGDYTRKSVEQTWSFLEKLAAARSPARAFELQMEYARQACDTLIAESQKISDLHGELAKQRAANFEGFVAKVTQTTLVLRATRH